MYFMGTEDRAMANYKETEMNMNADVTMESYIQFITTMSESTDDYLFLQEIATDKVWFSKLISKRYCLQDKGEDHCCVQDMVQIVYPNDRRALEEDLNRIVRGESDVHNMEYRWVDRNGDIVWISCRGRVVCDKNGTPLFLMGRVSDTALRHKVDAMTGLFNKVKMSEDLTSFFEKSDAGFCIVLGIDNFKNINIRFGRDYGDEVLKDLAKLIENIVGNPLQIYRLEGDCFAVHLPYAVKEDVLIAYEQIQSNLTEEYTVSMGAVPYAEVSNKDVGLVYQYAEEALDKAKKNGKNRVVFFMEDDYNKKISEIELLEEIRNSVKNGCQGFSLVYQPQVESKSHRLYGAEALLRYESPKKGRVFPDQFIPLLEETGLICPVGLWVVENALKDCKKWRQKNPDFHVSVNVSYVQLKQESVVDRVLELLKESGLPGEVLTLEVTESMQLQDFKHFNELFFRWKNAGIEISVDDFGTGYSSLAYLKNLNIDEIKIDKCFVSGIQFSSYNYRLISNMLELAKESEIRVCCEGVELEEEMMVLEDLNARLLQGYLFAKPCEKAEFEKLYIDNEVPEYCQRIRTTIMRGNVKPVESKPQEKVGDYVDFRYEEILKVTGMGLWVIRIDEKNGTYEMFADENMRRVLAVDRDLTPEECYQHWYSRISDGYYDYVNRNVALMIEQPIMVQLEYTWTHPVQGQISVRCVGIRVEDKDGKICLEGYHRNISNLEQTQFLAEEVSQETFEYSERWGRIFFHTGRTLIAGEDVHEYEFPECWIESGVVHPHFCDIFRETFTNIGEKEEVTDFELMMKTKQGDYSWFKLSTRHLGENEVDKNTVLVQLTIANKERRQELENLRIRTFYQAILGEPIAFIEMDLESRQVLETGGLWKGYTKLEEERIAEFLKYVDFDEVARIGKTSYRRISEYDIHGEKRPVEVVLHIVKGPFSANMYALLYLKDIEFAK